MLIEPVTALINAGAEGAPLAGVVPMTQSLASAVVLGFLALASGTIWLIGELSAPPDRLDEPPARYREAA